MACKCGAKLRPTPELVVELGSGDLRTAEVFFRQRLAVQLNGDHYVFMASEIRRLNFALIEALLAMVPDALSFRNPQEAATYYA